MDSPFSINTRQRERQVESTNQRCFASRVVGSHFVPQCYALHGSCRVCLITGDTSVRKGPSPPPRLKHTSEGLAPEVPNFRWMLTGSKAFLGLPGTCGLWSCARTHLKWFCATLVRLVGRITNTSSPISVTQSRVIPFVLWLDSHYHSGLSAFYQLTTV